MEVKEVSQVERSLDYLYSYVKNDSAQHKVILSFTFKQNKKKTKKKAKTDEMILSELSKESICLPNNFGASPKIALYTFRKYDFIDGVDYIGSDNLIQSIQEGTIVPNYLITFREDMPMLTKHSRLLGPKGLMPTPKQGTIVEEGNLSKIVSDFKKGSIKIKINKNFVAQVAVGIVNMNKKKVEQNIETILLFFKTKLPSAFIRSNLKHSYLEISQAPSCDLIIK